MKVRDKLYVMKPGFVNAGLGPFYCGDSVSVEGLLGFFPELREKVEVIYIDFPRPRKAIVEQLGEEHQSVPVLILAENSPRAHKAIETAKGCAFISSEKAIREYLSTTFGLPQAG